MTDWSELVLDIADDVPPGRATTYGLIAEAARLRTGRGSARSVGAVMAREGGAVAWWRVVRADGSLPEQLTARAAEHYRGEGTPRRPGGAVDLTRALWDPLEETHA
ncbi:MGMT family protein [Georgenia phoenicis]|uniref:MGMT family protein n=1 Tax=unclassified Georgenia TaxID=2626815 RepID=UPI0039B011E4